MMFIDILFNLLTRTVNINQNFEQLYDTPRRPYKLRGP